MWVFLNDAFLSIVKHRTKADTLLVRSRIAGDLERVFPGCKVLATPRADYPYRAEVKRAKVEEAMRSAVREIDYDNFKGSVHPMDQRREAAYLGVWRVMAHAGDDPATMRSRLHVMEDSGPRPASLGTLRLGS